jgi:hypothetical protein
VDFASLMSIDNRDSQKDKLGKGERVKGNYQYVDNKKVMFN